MKHLLMFMIASIIAGGSSAQSLTEQFEKISCKNSAQTTITTAAQVVQKDAVVTEATADVSGAELAQELSYIYDLGQKDIPLSAVCATIVALATENGLSQTAPNILCSRVNGVPTLVEITWTPACSRWHLTLTAGDKMGKIIKGTKIIIAP